jgi:hypothetical protein
VRPFVLQEADMAGGKRHKFHGSTFQIITGFDEDSPNPAITGVTAANPPVVTAAGHGLSDGDVVKITGVLGMVELNDEIFIVQAKTNDTFELADVSGASYGAYTSGGEIQKATFSNFCELTNYNRQGGTSPEIPATSACSTAQEFEIGLPDYGTTQIDYNFAPRTAVQLAVQEAYDSGDKIATRVTLPKSGGTMVQLGYIQQTSENAGVGGLWVGSLTMRNTGPRADFA